MVLGNENLDSIVIKAVGRGRLVDAENGQEVLAIIADDKIVVKDGYAVKLVSVEQP